MNRTLLPDRNTKTCKAATDQNFCNHQNKFTWLQFFFFKFCNHATSPPLGTMEAHALKPFGTVLPWCLGGFRGPLVGGRAISTPPFGRRQFGAVQLGAVPFRRRTFGRRFLIYFYFSSYEEKTMKQAIPWMPLSANLLKLGSSVLLRAKRASKRNNVAVEKRRIFIFFLNVEKNVNFFF